MERWAAILSLTSWGTTLLNASGEGRRPPFGRLSLEIQHLRGRFNTFQIVWAVRFLRLYHCGFAPRTISQKSNLPLTFCRLGNLGQLRLWRVWRLQSRGFGRRCVSRISQVSCGEDWRLEWAGVRRPGNIEGMRRAEYPSQPNFAVAFQMWLVRSPAS